MASPTHEIAASRRPPRDGAYRQPVRQSRADRRGPTCAYVRYVVQWNAMLQPSDGPNPETATTAKFGAWYEAVAAHMPSLTLDLSLGTSHWKAACATDRRPVPRAALERHSRLCESPRGWWSLGTSPTTAANRGGGTGIYVAPVRAANTRCRQRWRATCIATTVVGNRWTVGTCRWSSTIASTRGADGWQLPLGGCSVTAVTASPSATRDQFTEIGVMAHVARLPRPVRERYGSTAP